MLENLVSKPFKTCVDISMQANSDFEAKQLFWEAFKEKARNIPSKSLANCTEDLLFNRDKNCFELKLIVPFPDEMLKQSAKSI